MWWIPPSVAKAALLGPTTTLLTWAHLRNSLGNGAISSSCPQRERPPAETAVASSISMDVFIFTSIAGSLCHMRCLRKADFDQPVKRCDELDGRNGQNGLLIKALSRLD